MESNENHSIEFESPSTRQCNSIDIADRHNLAIVHLINIIVDDSAIKLDNFDDVNLSLTCLVKLINRFDNSFVSRLVREEIDCCDESSRKQICEVLKTWLTEFYSDNLLTDSEDFGIFALLILNVFYQFRSILPALRGFLETGWMYLSEFDNYLETFWNHKFLLEMLFKELNSERREKKKAENKVQKLRKELTTTKSTLTQMKTMITNLKKQVKPGPKSKKKEAAKALERLQTALPKRHRKKNAPNGRRKKRTNHESSESEVEADTPPPPGTPVTLSSSGTGGSCRYCGKWFNTGDKLNRHLISHASLKPFACDWPGCGRPFDTNYKLQRHRRSHTGERPFICEICYKKYSRSDKLREHQKSHAKQTQYVNSSIDSLDGQDLNDAFNDEELVDLNDKLASNIVADNDDLVSDNHDFVLCSVSFNDS